MKRAFTLLELVFVIVVIGILAAAIIPRIQDNNLEEAGIDLLSKIRYTQHLAVLDDKMDPKDASWYQKRWRITFKDNKYSIICKDQDNNTIYAKKPINASKNIENIDLQKKYNVTATVSGTECGVSTANDEYMIGFDYSGRPLSGDIDNATGIYSNLIKSNDCKIQLSDGTAIATIQIERETGYVTITY